jgi:hypothetical protein
VAVPSVVCGIPLASMADLQLAKLSRLSVTPEFDLADTGPWF